MHPAPVAAAPGSDAQTDALVAELLARTASTGSEWEEVGVNKGGVMVWKEKGKDSAGVSIRGRCEIDASFEVVMGLLRDAVQKKQWDEMFSSREVAEERFNGATSVQTEAFRGIWPVARCSL
jgi:hypothetical protein